MATAADLCTGPSHHALRLDEAVGCRATAEAQELLGRLWPSDLHFYRHHSVPGPVLLWLSTIGPRNLTGTDFPSVSGGGHLRASASPMPLPERPRRAHRSHASTLAAYGATLAALTGARHPSRATPAAGGGMRHPPAGGLGGRGVRAPRHPPLTTRRSPNATSSPPPRPLAPSPRPRTGRPRDRAPSPRAAPQRRGNRRSDRRARRRARARHDSLPMRGAATGVRAGRRGRGATVAGG